MTRVLTQDELTLLAARHVDPVEWYGHVSARFAAERLDEVLAEQFAACAEVRARPGHKPRAQQESEMLANIKAEDAVCRTAFAAAHAATVASAGDVPEWQAPLLKRSAVIAGHEASEKARREFRKA